MTDVYSYNLHHSFGHDDLSSIASADYFSAPAADASVFHIQRFDDPKSSTYTYEGSTLLANEFAAAAYPSPSSSHRASGSPFSLASDVADYGYTSSDSCSSSSSMSDFSQPATPNQASPFGAFRLSPAGQLVSSQDEAYRTPPRASFSGVSSSRPPLRTRLSLQGLQKRYVCNRCPWQTNFVEYMERHCHAHDGRALFDCVLGDCTEAFETVEQYLAHIDEHEELARQDLAIEALQQSQTTVEHLHRRDSNSSISSSTSSASSDAFDESFRAVPRTLTYGQDVAPQLTVAPAICSSSSGSRESSSAPWSAPSHVSTFAEAESSRSAFKRRDSQYQSAFFAALPATSSSSSDDDEYDGEALSTGHGSTRASRDAMLAKIHKCSFPGCDKAFKRREHRKRHEKIHTEERPWQCEVCERCFTRKDNLAAHRRTHDRLSLSARRQAAAAGRRARA